MERKPYPIIADVPEKIDVVDVFRKSEEVPAVIDDAINRKKNDIQVIWMQLGIYNEEAEKESQRKWIDVVYNRCMMEEHKRLLGGE